MVKVCRLSLVQDMFSGDLPVADAQQRLDIAKMLGREPPDESGVKDIIMKQ